MTLRVRVANLDDAGPIARVQVDTWRTTYAGIVPTEYLAGLSYRDRESKWTDILSAGRPVESNFVAETDGGEVVGFAGGGPEREGNPTFRGELYAIYLFEEYRRAGVGRRLVSAVARRLLDAGVGAGGQPSGVHLLRVVGIRLPLDAGVGAGGQPSGVRLLRSLVRHLRARCGENRLVTGRHEA